MLCARCFPFISPRDTGCREGLNSAHSLCPCGEYRASVRQHPRDERFQVIRLGGGREHGMIRSWCPCEGEACQSLFTTGAWSTQRHWISVLCARRTLPLLVACAVRTMFSVLISGESIPHSSPTKSRFFKKSANLWCCEQALNNA